LNFVIPGRAEGANPESISTAVRDWHCLADTVPLVDMDSGLAAARRPGMTALQDRAP
jgi:hypothetical protein